MDPAQIEAAVELGLSGPHPNAYAAAFAALHQFCDAAEIPTAAEIQSTWDRIAAHREWSAA